MISKTALDVTNSELIPILTRYCKFKGCRGFLKLLYSLDKSWFDFNRPIPMILMKTVIYSTATQLMLYTESCKAILITFI